TKEALAAIGEFTGVDRSYISLFDDEGTVMSITHEWCASGIEPQIQDLQNVSIEPLEWSMEALKSLRVLPINDVSDLPPEAAVEKELFKSQGIVSAILVPMAYKNTFMGFIGFDSVGTRRIWSVEDTTLLKMAGSIFASALIRRKAEMSIRESEEKLRSVMETVPGIVMTADRDGVVQYINRSVPEMTAEEAIGTRIMDHIQPEFHDTAIQCFNTVFETEQGAEYQAKGLGPDGKTLWYFTRIEPIKGPGGVTGATAISFDITEQKRTTEALKESEEKFRTIFENVNDEILYLDMNGKIIDVNGRGETIFGWKREEVVGRQFSEFDFVDPALMSGFSDSFMRAAQGENTGLVSIKAKRKDGTRVFIEANISLIEHEDVPQNLLITVRDVSDRMRVEEALKESEANWRSLTENSPDQIMTLDPDARIIFANRLVSNWTKQPTVGTSFYEHTSEEYKPVASKCFDEVLRTGKTTEFESVFRDDKGNLHYLEYYVGPVMRPGRVSGLTVRSTDITQRKQSEKALLQANAGLNYLNSLARTLAQCTTPKDVFERALDQTLDSLGLPIGAIYLLDEDENVLTLVTYSGMDESLARASRNINIKPNGTKITSRKASMDTQIADRARAVLQSIGLPFCMISPLQSHNRTLGLVCVASQEERDFSEEDARLLETVGAEIGISMERARLLDELKELSRTDDLTGLDNRRRFYEVLEAEISRVTRYGGSSSLVMIDLDGFKEYNDKLGHTNGDAILRSFARMLRSALRKSDIAFRYGGDEFVIVLPSTPSDKVHRVIKRIQSRWAQIMDKHVPDGGIKLDFSAGTVQLPEDAETPDALIFLADTALYYSKRMGGARLTVASDLGPSEADTFGTATPDQVYALASTVDAKDKYTFGHSARVASIAGKLGKATGLSQKELADLYSASILHDIGKIGVPDSVLCKPGKLTDEEWLLIKRHSSEGSKIVGHIKELRSIVPYILHHHEWYDGNGYPDGLAGKDIPLAARIISIADAYDTMTTDRTYRRAMSSELAIAELRRCKGTQFDPHLVKEFCKAFDIIEDRITDDGMQTIPE
ncbi:MAG: PAS domain S-box protein, partial [Chloroflexi bacterium]|nr:PAS domain S-box protein [Chloroflexota bacterium]